MIRLTRRQTLAGIASMAALPATGAFAQSLALPSAPVALSIIDVAGNLALTQKAMQAYADKNPKLVSAITFNKATAPEGAVAGIAGSLPDACRPRDRARTPRAPSVPVAIHRDRSWWVLRVSNPRPSPCKGDALPLS